MKVNKMKWGSDKDIDALFDLASTNPVKARSFWDGLTKDQQKHFKYKLDITDAANENNYGGFLYLIYSQPETISKKEAQELGIIDADGLGFVKPQTAFKNITEQLLAELKKENLIWRKGWRSGVIIKGKTYGAQNYETQRPYTGSNAFFINMQNLLNGTNYNFFLTPKQIAARGGTLQKGAKPYPVCVFIKNIVTKTVIVDGKNTDVNTEEKGIIWYHVFPIDKVENLKPIVRKTLKPDTFNEVIVAEADKIIELMPKAPPIKHGGDRAYYAPSPDYVQMPHKKAFNVQQEYYSVLFHELIHSTGNKKRLDRDLTGKFGDKSYAGEELIAEIGAAFLCGVCEIDYFTVNNSAAYLKGWAKTVTQEITNDPNFLKRSVFKAVRAANFIIGSTLEKHGIVKDGSNSPITESVTTPEEKKEKPKKVKINLAEGIETPNFKELQKKVSVLNLKRFQELVESFQEGILILKSGLKIDGSKCSPEALEQVKKSVLSTVKKINDLVIDEQEEQPEDKPTLQIFEDIVNSSSSLSEAYKKAYNNKNVLPETATYFYNKYNPTGELSSRQAFEVFYKEIKGDEEADPNKPTFTGDIKYETAYRAHTGTSFSPEKRAKTAMNDFAEDLESVYDVYNKASDKTLVLSCFNEYRSAAASLYNKWLQSKASLMSSMIVGPANFPVARMRKLNGYADNHYNRYQEVTDKLLVKHKKMLGLIAPSGIIKSGSENAITDLKAKLEKLEQAQELTKNINKAMRSKNPKEALVKYNISDKLIAELLSASNGGKGIPTYVSTNRGAEIRRLKERIASEEKLNVKREVGNEKFAIEGGYILKNFEATRYQIYFDEKPNEAMRTKLKSHGFKWSPSFVAWQSFLTPNTAYKIKLLFGDVLKESTVFKPTEKHYPGKEITPNKSAKASVGQAIEDLMAITPKLKKIGAMGLSMLYSAYKTENFPDTNEGLKGKLFEKMEEQGLVEFNAVYELTDEGMEVVKKIEARLTTLKAKKSGTDLFPELSGVTDAVLIFINAFLSLHNKTVSKEDLLYILTNFQNAIKSGMVKAKHPLSAIANTTQDKLVKVINGLSPKQNIKLNISNKVEIENKILGLHGLGFWSVIASAVVGKTAEYFTKKAIEKKAAKESLNGIEGFTRADKSPEIKALDTYRLNGELGKLLGDIQPYKYSIVLTGDPHAGKTEFTMQLANGFAEVGKKVGAFMLEQGGLESKDTKAAIERNVTPKNQQNVYVTGEALKGIDSIKEFANKFNVIIIDSWQKLGIPSTKFDSLRHEFPNTVFIVIFQQNGEGGTRGGVSADYDTPVLLKVHKVDATFVNNYVEVKKNRGNSKSLGLQYMVKAKKTITVN